MGWGKHCPAQPKDRVIQEIEYLYEPETFRPLAQVTHKADQASQLHYIVTDHAGTPQELCSENGDVVWQGEQALWGHYQQRNALPNHGFRENAHNDELYCDLRYQGQIEDRESGLYYNVNRYYDADSGQYLSPDPIGFAGGLRPQAYVFNPLDWVDPLGLAGEAHEDGSVGKNRRQAMNEAKDAVNIPRSQQHENHWVVGDDATRRGYPNYVYSDNPSEHGRFYQYRDANNHKVVVVEHNNDPRNKLGTAHFHGGKAKANPRDYDFKTERYGKVITDKQTGDHHIYYD